jgi:hypothetical protein
MALVEHGCHWNHVCFLWGVAEADETIECQTYKSVEHNQVAEVLNEINAQFAVRIKKWAVQESMELHVHTMAAGIWWARGY